MSDRDDLNELLNGAIDAATEQLAEHSEFTPFALAMQASDGEVFQLDPDDDEVADGEQVVAALEAMLRDAGERWRAVAVVADVTLEGDDGEPVTAAIHVAMEHADGEPVTCMVPYSIEGEQVELADLVAEPGEPRVFPIRVTN